MKISQHLHQRIRFRSLLITILLLCLLGSLAWLSSVYTLQADWTANASNTLSDASKKVLDTLTDNVEITAYLNDDAQPKKQFSILIARYKHYNPNLTSRIIALDSDPQTVRELDIGQQGAIFINYQGRTEKLKSLDESSLSNALLRLSNANERWITFLSGHGERSPTGMANHDLGTFGKTLEQRKIKVQTLNLATMPAIPDNSSLLVIAGPTVPLLTNEIALIRQYVIRGGNLLWLTDPDNDQIRLLEDLTGIHQLPGTIIDSGSQLYGVDNPTFVVASEYTPHPITRDFQMLTVFPAAAALEIDNETDYAATTLLTSVIRSWTETGSIVDTVRFDADSEEREGPLDIAIALTKDLDNDRQQRIVIIGDGDFIANTYIGNVGNLDLGLRLINWLTYDDRHINIPAKLTTDSKLQLTQTAVTVMGFGFLLIMPLLLISTGLLIRYKRKRR